MNDKLNAAKKDIEELMDMMMFQGMSREDKMNQIIPYVHALTKTMIKDGLMPTDGLIAGITIIKMLHSMAPDKTNRIIIESAVAALFTELVPKDMRSHYLKEADDARETE